MGIINVLDKHTANLIAAGEVVERPASAVKEMLENCADAGADCVTVEIKDGGTSFIRISDNGCGIARDDVPKTILRHATSKIKSGGDLEAIATLGFRGEALAAIAAVSRIRILTKRAEDETGTLFMCNFGEIVSTEDAGCPDGTTIIVEGIFENTPARRKFLKKNITEAAAVLAVCEKFALSRPQISLKLISDGNTRLETPGDNKLENTIYSAIGKEFATNLLAVDYEYSSIRSHGYIGKPEVCRPNRNMQNFFVNGRYVKSRTMLAALEEGFRGFCPTGKFPACVLFLEIDLRLVDVNIHPAKLEIKFSDERKVFDTIYFSVKNALSRGISNALGFDFGDNHEEDILQYGNYTKQSNIANSEKKAENVVYETPIKSEVSHETEIKSRENSDSIFEMPERKAFSDGSGINDSFLKIKKEKTDEREQVVSFPSLSAVSEDVIQTNSEVKEQLPIENFVQPVIKNTVFEQQEIPVEKNVCAKYIGEVFDTYLVVQREKSMYLIDKHAAHERIIYERIKHAADNNDAQNLIEPVSVTLTPKEFDAVATNGEYFKKIGFDCEEFGTDTFLLRSKPCPIDYSDIKDVFTFLAGKLAEGNTKSAGEVFDRALYTAACKAAIKAGNKFTELDNKRICNEIFENDAVLYCPHGRPVLIEYTKERIEKMFGRT